MLLTAAAVHSVQSNGACCLWQVRSHMAGGKDEVAEYLKRKYADMEAAVASAQLDGKLNMYALQVICCCACACADQHRRKCMPSQVHLQ